MERARSRVPSLAEIRAVAARLLSEAPDPVVRHRLIRAVFGTTLRSPEQACNPWVDALLSEQRDDGSWGRFHSQDSRCPLLVPTTEFAIERATALGLEPGHPALRRAAQYARDLLRGTATFPDPPEKNDRWLTGTQLFAAATLSLLRPGARVLHRPRRLWREILERSFSSGSYDAEGEARAHRELTGATVRGTYLTLDGRYQLLLLGTRPAEIPRALQRVWVRWLLDQPEGIRYLSVPLAHEARPSSPGQWDRWLTSMDLLLRLSGARILLRPRLAWLWRFRNQEGIFDFGRCPARSPNLPLSASWRRSRARSHDWTTRVLTLLARYHGAHRDG